MISFHWRTFLKLKLDPPDDIYLKYVIDKSPNFETYKKRIFSALLDFEPNDRKFISMYDARKSLLKDVKDYEVSEYIAETRIKESESVYYLTDNTTAERQAVIESLAGAESVTDIVEFVREYIPRKDDWTSIKNRIIKEHEQVKILAKISVDIDIRTGEVSFSLPDFGLTAKQTIIEDSVWDSC